MLNIKNPETEQAVRQLAAQLGLGKGRHPAGLNFCDCFSYALARSLDAPLLFVGNDFTLTDVTRATVLAD